MADMLYGKISEPALKALLQATTSLRCLELFHTGITDVTLTALAQHKPPLALDELYLARCFNITDKGIIALMDAGIHPKVLHLYNTRVTDQALPSIANKNRRLEYLSVGLCKAITNTGLLNVMNLPLQYLDCTGTSITDEVFTTKTAAQKTLRCFDSSFRPTTTDASIKALADQGTPLELVLICLEQCTELFFSALARFPKLKHVIVSDIFEREAVEKLTNLSTKYPSLADKIIHYFNAYTSPSLHPFLQFQIGHEMLTPRTFPA